VFLWQVAAIEMDMGSALDTNAELITVGVSNALSGLLGGFTGSYIFSQVG
jgi:SulP family sulfate permease